MRLSNWLANVPALTRLRVAAERVAGRDLVELLTICTEALARYKLRTTLSALGVVLGVAGVIAVMSVSQGARDEILRQVEFLGLDNIVVRDNFQSRGQRLTLRDAETLWQITPLLKSATPLVEGYVSLFGPAASRTTRLIGVTADYKHILRLSVTKGRFLSKLDDRALARVCVLGRRIASDLFGFREPVGESVRVAGKWYRVVGVLGERSMAGAGSGALATRDLNEVVLVPLSTLLAQPLHADLSTPVQEIWLHLSRGDRVIPVGRVVEETLARLHGGRGDFEVVVPRALMNQRLRTQRTFSVVVGSMASLTLLVGGIGIMNIMLASVLERTGEIGLRRTVGATKRDITMQFLVEALLLTSTGGAFGIALGIAISLGISAYAGWATRISPVAVLLAFFISFVTGLAFGIYPAVKAARLQPIDAMRYE